MGGASSGHHKNENSTTERRRPSRHWVPYPSESVASNDSLDHQSVFGPNYGPRVVKAVDLTSVLQPCACSNAYVSHTPGVRWGVDCQFLPYDDSKLLTCIAPYDWRGERNWDNWHRAPCITSGIINVWSLDAQNQGCMTEIHRRTSIQYPHCQMTPDGGFVCYLEDCGNITVCNINNIQQNYRLGAHHICGVGHFCSMSPDEMFVATITRQQPSFFQLCVLSIQCEDSFKRANCHDIFPEFLGNRPAPTYRGSEQVECRFSPDSQLIAVGGSAGQLFVAKKCGLMLYRGVLPGICGKAAGLANARMFDFDPRFGHEVMAVCTSDHVLQVCNLELRTHVWKICLPETIGSPDSLKYNREGDILAVSGSEAKIGLFHSSKGDIHMLLDTADQCVHFAMKRQPVSGCYPTMLRLSFTHNTSHLAAASTDGFVRIWHLQQRSTLQSVSVD